MRTPQQIQSEALHGKVTPTLLRLAAPNIAINGMLAVSNGIDAYYVGRLGPDALAGVSLTFPALTLMQSMIVGGMGVGVTSAIARALGARDHDRAQRLAVHALLMATGLSVLFAGGLCWAGVSLYRAMGGGGVALVDALAYSNVMFGGAAAMWLFQTLSAIVRGTGKMTLPAVLVVAGEVVHVGLAPLLMFGGGPVRAMGIAGAAVSVVVLFTVRLAALAFYMRSKRTPIRLRFAGFRLQKELAWDILRVALPASVGAILMNANVMIATGYVGTSGSLAVAGYGMGARLEYLLTLIVFGLGAAILTMVGMNRGAGNVARSERIAWTGAALAGGFTGSIGLVVAIRPAAYMHLFTDEPGVVQVGVRYLQSVAPTYALFGCGLALFFVAQGAGQPKAPFVASCARFTVTVVGGWLGMKLFGGLTAIFIAIATGFAVHAGVLALAVRRGLLRRAAKPPSTQPDPASGGMAPKEGSVNKYATQT